MCLREMAVSLQILYVCVSLLSGASGAWDNSQRLPTDVYPLEYNVRLQPEFYDGCVENDACKLKGRVRIHLRTSSATDVIILNAKNLHVTKDVKISGEGRLAVKNVIDQPENERFVIELTSALQVGKDYELEIEYECPLLRDLRGIYLAQYKTPTGESKYMVASQFQSTDARKAFPCFDEPAFKAIFNIVVFRMPGMTSLSNAILESSVPDTQTSWIRDTFRTTPMMSTYLVAVSVSEFAFIEERSQQSNVLMRVWSSPDKIHHAHWALEAGIQQLDFFEDKYNIEFPLEKVDMIVVPEFGAGAMENWGLIMYQEAYLLYDETVNPLQAKFDVANVVSHELSHQWFGNLVTPKWWDDLWLNEGFAAYIENHGSDLVASEFMPLSLFQVETLQVAMVHDGISESHPIYKQSDNVLEIENLFDHITYYKGASVIRMVEFFLGEDTFWTGVNQYLEQYKYKNADHEDLFRSLAAVAESRGLTINVVDAIKSWILQMGYPVVTFVPLGGGRASVTQEHFLYDSENTPESSEFNYKWDIPLTFTSADNPNWNEAESQIMWMNRGNIEVGSSDGYTDSGWLVANIGQLGFYRVNYYENNWNKIIQQLISDHSVIDVRSRGQLLDDSFNLVLAKRLDIRIPLRMSTYMLNEMEFLPWKIFAKNSNEVFKRINNPQILQAYKRRMVELANGLYNEFGWTPEPNDSPIKRRFIGEIVDFSCAMGHEPCIEALRNRFNSWKNGGAGFHNDVKEVAFKAITEHFGVEAWDFLMDQYNQATDANEQKLMLKGLANSNADAIQRSVDLLMSNTITITGAKFLIMFTSNLRIDGRKAVWRLMRDRWQDVLDKFGGMAFIMKEVIGGALGGLQTSDELAEVDRFIQENQSGIEEAKLMTFFQAGRNSVRNNIDWVERNTDNIQNWLNE